MCRRRAVLYSRASNPDDMTSVHIDNSSVRFRLLSVFFTKKIFLKINRKNERTTQNNQGLKVPLPCTYFCLYK